MLSNHLSFLLNRLTIIFVGFCFLFVIIANIIISNFYLDKSYVEMYNNYYYEAYYTDNIFFLKIIVVTLSVFICVYMFGKDKIIYQVFYLSKGVKKEVFILTKILSIIITNGFFIYLCFIIYILICKLLTPFNINFYRDFFTFIKVFLLMCNCVMITILLIQITKSMFSGLITIIIYWTSELSIECYESYNNLNLINKILHFINPGLILDTNGKYVFIHDTLHVILLIFILFTSIVVLYINNDIV